MESEKVKELKKALEHCAIHDCSDSCIFSEKHPFACLTEMHKQLLNLINELESENCKTSCTEEIRFDQSFKEHWFNEDKNIDETVKHNITVKK